MGILIKAPARRREPPLAEVEAPANGGDTRGALHIREVVRITGLRREQPYMWQRRYGFPSPLRDAFGDRVCICKIWNLKHWKNPQSAGQATLDPMR